MNHLKNTIDIWVYFGYIFLVPSLKYNLSYGREELEKAVKQNISIMGVIRALGATQTSGSFRRKLTRQIKNYDIDTSHFLGRSWNNGLGKDHKGGLIKQDIKPEDQRICSKCGLSKQAKDFYRRKTSYRMGDYYEKCKECMLLRGRNYFHQNHDRQYYLAKLRQQRYSERSIELVIGIKKVTSCQDCGKIYPPCAMDFDHREGEIKFRSISYLCRRGSNIDILKKEIAKCDLVCAVCHRIRTFNRLHNNAAVANVVTAGL